MTVPAIHVHTQSDKNTIGYVTFMWETMRSLANHPEALKLTVHCMGPTAADRLASLPASKTYRVPNVGTDVGLMGSVGHAICVEHALAMTDDGDIHIIVDADTVVLARGWDDYVRCELLDKKVGIIGTRYEDVGGFSSGASRSQTYKNVPNVVWMAMSPLHRWQDLKAQPFKGDDLHVTNEGMARIYGIPVGYQVLRDVAWQLPEYLSNRGITYTGWRQLKPSKGEATVLRGLSDYHEEYHVSVDDVPFVVHHRGSLRHAYRGETMSQAFYTAVDTYLEQEMKRPPRWIWTRRPENEHVFPVLEAAKTAAHERLQAFDRAHQIELPPRRENPLMTVDSTSIGIPGSGAGIAQPAAASQEPWLKVVVDGESAWSRHDRPAPQGLSINFTPDNATRNIRIEGTVPALEVMLPGVEKRQYTMTVRNMLAGPTVVRAKDASRTVEVPAGACWLVLIDVDGPVHVA